MDAQDLLFNVRVRPCTDCQEKLIFSANERKYTQIINIGKNDSRLLNICVHLRLSVDNLFFLIIRVYLRSFAEESNSFFFFTKGHSGSPFLRQVNISRVR